MTTPELPPLKLPALPSLPSRSLADHERYIIELREVMRCRERLLEARERILQARIAELEADAERYRWLRDEAQYADDGLPYVIAWKRGRSAGEQEILAEEELDAAIDAARRKS